MITTAVIMAAGKGTRFGSRTADMPKGFIEFKGKSMIERSIINLLDAGIRRIIIGTGYHHEWYERLSEQYAQITTVFSPFYAESNSMETLYQCRHAIGKDDFLLLESDLVYERKALDLLLDDAHENVMLISEVTKFQDQYYIVVDEHKNLTGCSTDKEYLWEKYGEEPYDELVGIHKISNQFYKEMIEDYGHHRHDNIKRGYEYELEDIATAMPVEASIVKTDDLVPISTCHASKRIPLFVLKPKSLQWYEIDDEQDLVFAERHLKIN